MKAGRVLVALLLISAPASAAHLCRSNPKVVAPCFVVHGRLSNIHQGSISTRIWIVGTHRYLGVFDGYESVENRDDPILRENLDSLLGEPSDPRFVFGQFEVCPFTKLHRGEMQLVCVEKASGLVARRP